MEKKRLFLQIKTPCVLQLQNLRVVSAPNDAEAGEESLAGPKICRLSLTDGHMTCSAVTLETVKGLKFVLLCWI